MERFSGWKIIDENFYNKNIYKSNNFNNFFMQSHIEKKIL